jgi:hypothetical protein
VSSPDDLVGSAVEAVHRHDARAACNLYEQAAVATRPDDIRPGTHLLLTAAIYAREQPDRRDALSEQAQLHCQDAHEFDSASEVAFARAANAEQAGQRSESVSLYVASIALGGRYLAEHAYDALKAGSPVIELEETASRIGHASRAIQRPNP